jgi:diguanylate cyclase (GGDEF)-like protein
MTDTDAHAKRRRLRRWVKISGVALLLAFVGLLISAGVSTRGHAAGDELLRQFSTRLKAAVRPTDAVARLGGDEFAIVLVGVREATHIATVADKVVEAASAPYEVGGHSLRIGASVGAAHNAELAGGWKGLVARADAKAYEAKAAGRGRRVLSDFGETVTSRVSDRQAG